MNQNPNTPPLGTASRIATFGDPDTHLNEDDPVWLTVEIVGDAGIQLATYLGRTGESLETVITAAIRNYVGEATA